MYYILNIAYYHGLFGKNAVIYPKAVLRCLATTQFHVSKLLIMWLNIARNEDGDHQRHNVFYGTLKVLQQ